MIALPVSPLTCPHCRRRPCACDRDAGDVGTGDYDVDDLDVYAELRRFEAQDRAEYFLRPYRPEDSR